MVFFAFLGAAALQPPFDAATDSPSPYLKCLKGHFDELIRGSKDPWSVGRQSLAACRMLREQEAAEILKPAGSDGPGSPAISKADASDFVFVMYVQKASKADNAKN